MLVTFLRSSVRVIAVRARHTEIGPESFKKDEIYNQKVVQPVKSIGER